MTQTNAEMKSAKSARSAGNKKQYTPADDADKRRNEISGNQ